MIRREDFLFDRSGAGRPPQLSDAMAREIARARRYGGGFSFAIVGIDDIDDIAARSGPTRMTILRERIVELVARNTRDADLISYHGRGEIAALLPETPAEGAYVVAERIRAHVERTLRHAVARGRDVRVSVGVATYMDRPGLNVDAIVGEAEEALRAAQAEGGNRCRVFDVA